MRWSATEHENVGKNADVLKNNPNAEPPVVSGGSIMFLTTANNVSYLIKPIQRICKYPLLIRVNLFLT